MDRVIQVRIGDKERDGTGVQRQGRVLDREDRFSYRSRSRVSVRRYSREGSVYSEENDFSFRMRSLHRKERHSVERRGRSDSRRQGGMVRDRSGRVVVKESQGKSRGKARYYSPVLLERADAYYDREFPRLQNEQYCRNQITDKLEHHGGKQNTDKSAQHDGTQITDNSDVKRFVSFYFTNVPELIPYYCLRQGFEVCGILEDLYLSKKLNAQGKVFGFV